jgi:hypothetical protein
MKFNDNFLTQLPLNSEQVQFIPNRCRVVIFHAMSITKFAHIRQKVSQQQKIYNAKFLYFGGLGTR